MTQHSDVAPHLYAAQNQKCGSTGGIDSPTTPTTGRREVRWREHVNSASTTMVLHHGVVGSIYRVCFVSFVDRAAHKDIRSRDCQQ